MSKKKNRQEKTSKFHNFSHLKKSQKSDQVEDKQEVQKSTSAIDPIYIYDLKRVLFYIGIIVVLILVLTFLVYKTNLLNPLFTKFGIQY